MQCSFCAYSIIPGLQETLLSIDTKGGGGVGSFVTFSPMFHLYFSSWFTGKKKPTLLVCRPVGGVVDFSDSSPLINKTRLRKQK